MTSRLGELKELTSKLASLESERDTYVHKLKEKERAARTLINAPLETVILLDVNGVVKAINDIGAHRLGHSVEELVGKNIFDFLPPEVAKFRKDKYEEALKTGHIVRFIDKRDSRWYDQIVYPVFNNGNKQAIELAIYSTDITDSKEINQRIKIYSTVVEQMSDGVIIFDFDGIIKFVNPALVQRYGYNSYKEMVDKNIKDVIFDENFTENYATDLYNKVLKTGEKVNFILKHKNRQTGKQYKVWVTLSILKDDDSTPFVFVAVGKVISLEDEESFKKICEEVE